MRKTLLLLICGCVVLFAAGHASAMKLGVGAFGGLNFPLVMDDVDNGSAFGFKVRLELKYANGDPDPMDFPTFSIGA